MSPFTRNSVILSAVGLLLIIVSLGSGSIIPRVWQLNALLDEEPVIGAYPYDFRVLTFLNGIVTLSSPRASTVDERWTLTQIDPALAELPAADPAWSAAARQLSETEFRAIAVLLEQPDVDSVVWSLDRAWFHRHDMDLPPQAQPGP